MYFTNYSNHSIRQGRHCKTCSVNRRRNRDQTEKIVPKSSRRWSSARDQLPRQLFVCMYKRCFFFSAPEGRYMWINRSRSMELTKLKLVLQWFYHSKLCLNWSLSLSLFNIFHLSRSVPLMQISHCVFAFRIWQELHSCWQPMNLNAFKFLKHQYMSKNSYLIGQ